MPANSSPYLTQKQAAVYLGVSERSLRTYVSRGDLRACRLKSSRLLRFRVEDLDAMMQPVPSAKGAA